MRPRPSVGAEVSRAGQKPHVLCEEGAIPVQLSGGTVNLAEQYYPHPAWGSTERANALAGLSRFGINRAIFLGGGSFGPHSGPDGHASQGVAHFRCQVVRWLLLERWL